MKPIGEHYIVEASGCDPEIIGNVEKMQDILVKAAQKANVKIWAVSFHRFPPNGVSGVIVISESHISIHTWPEHRYVALDIYTCGEYSNPEEAVNYALQQFRAENVHISEITRGIEEGDKLFYHSIITWEEELSHYKEKLKQESFLKILKHRLFENSITSKDVITMLVESFEKYYWGGIYKYNGDKEELVFSSGKEERSKIEETKVKSEIILPLSIKDKKWGYLMVKSSSKEGFKESDEAFLKKVIEFIEKTLKED